MLSNAPKGWQGVDIKKLIKAEIGEQQLIGLTNLTAREVEKSYKGICKEHF